MKNRTALAIGTVALVCSVSVAQSNSVRNNLKAGAKNDRGKQGATATVKPSDERPLARGRVMSVSSEDAGMLYMPIRCDGDGNIYFEVDSSGGSGIRKLSPSGERLAVFQPGTNSDLK